MSLPWTAPSETERAAPVRSSMKDARSGGNPEGEDGEAEDLPLPAKTQ
eukprot:CAMPEP_0181339768 /NCGR_PEP_ID=MMETSP1101-20121128/29464_1 /TAXON_ID=46948 /ORGANISM="Rhodomonas abbreviata, Strain Caron Lab Isolate" /LENGTH=47 /DNA_ID= /DNA_START= /DNA_END= /DNA_ORIENTATION=